MCEICACVAYALGMCSACVYVQVDTSSIVAAEAEEDEEYSGRYTADELKQRQAKHTRVDEHVDEHVDTHVIRTQRQAKCQTAANGSLALPFSVGPTPNNASHQWLTLAPHGLMHAHMPHAWPHGPHAWFYCWSDT